MDTLTPGQRSEVMRRIRSRGTQPELMVRRLTHRLGYRFRLHRRDLPGTPDLVFPARKKVILVHGCFWHQHPECRLSRLPKSRVDYWEPKLEANQRRDARRLAELRARGWEPLVLWECEVRKRKNLAARIMRFLEEPDRDLR